LIILPYWYVLQIILLLSIFLYRVPRIPLAILQGLKTIKIETVPSAPVEPDSVFDQLESDRAQGFNGKPVTSAPFFYERSLSKPGCIDKVDTRTGLRTTGRFRNGVFETVNA